MSTRGTGAVSAGEGRLLVALFLQGLPTLPRSPGAVTLGVEGTYLPQDRRGLGRYVRNVLRQWQGLPHRLVLLTRKEVEALRREGFPFECAAASRGPRLDACWFPWNRVDWTPSCPRVVTIHDTVAFWGRPDRAGRSRLHRAVARAHRVVTVSEFSRREIARHLGVDPERVEVIPEGVDPVFHPRPRTPREDFLEKRTGGAPYILSVGNREPRKNRQCLLEAFGRLGGLPHRLVLTGEAPPDPRVIAIGHPPDEELAEWYRHADLFVFPSRYEGFGLPLLEAMACGAPVAAARAASLPEVGGDVPRWFDPEDPDDMARAIFSALEDPGGMREAGPRRAASFRWEETARRLLEVLLEAAGKAWPFEE